MSDKLKNAGLVGLIWLALAYFAIALYGRTGAAGTSAWYSSQVDATCVVEHRLDGMAMACLPGDRLAKKEPSHD